MTQQELKRPEVGDRVTLYPRAPWQLGQRPAEENHLPAREYVIEGWRGNYAYMHPEYPGEHYPVFRWTRHEGFLL